MKDYHKKATLKKHEEQRKKFLVLVFTITNFIRDIDDRLVKN